MKQVVLGLGSFLLVAAAVPGWAQPTADDPPNRVARLSQITGSVSFRPGSAEDWVSATVNYPLTTGDHLWTAESSYAVVRVAATAIHLAPQAAFAITQLDDTVLQASLSRGSMYIRVQVLGQGELVEIDTPNAAVSLLQGGAYRIDVDEEHATTSVRVRAGEAEVGANGKASRVRPGAMLQMVDQETARQTEGVPGPDAWEQECEAQDQGADQSLATEEAYVPSDMEGAEDLAGYGSWTIDGSYGAMWSPSDVPADWAPYRNGHWTFVGPWGWTWIDHAKWGFAPFHYGRWLNRGERWYWVPGKLRERAVYSPAVVAFVGGSRLHDLVGLRGGGLVAWIPLAPREPYKPPYHASDSYVRRINAAAVGDAPANGSLVTLRNRDQIVLATEATFTGAKPVASNGLRVPAGAGNAAVPINIGTMRPLRDSYTGGRADPVNKPATPPPDAFNRVLVVNHEAPEAPKLPVRSAPVAPQAQAPQVDRQRADQQRSEQQRTDQQRADQQRSEQQRSEQQRTEQQRADQQRSEQQRSEQQRAEQQRADQQRSEQQRSEQQRTEQQRADQQRSDQQRSEQQRAEQQRAEQQRANQQRAEQQRMDQQRADQQRAEQQRVDQMRAEQQRAEQQRMDQQRADQQRMEQQRMEQQRADQQRAEQQRIMEQQHMEQQRAEQQRAEEAKKAEEAARKKQ